MAFAGPTLPPAAIANDIWLSRFRTTLVAVLGGAVMGIACLAFYTSFEAIRSYAVRSQGIAPEHGWAVPLLVDSFIVVATGADLWFTTTKMRRAWWEIWWPKLLLAGAAGVSFVLNVAHAGPTWAARGVAAIPPAALVLGVELLMMVLRRATTIRAARLQAEMEAEQAAAMEAPVQRARIQIEAMRRPRRSDDELASAGARPAGAEPRTGALPRPAAPVPPAQPAARPAPRTRLAERDATHLGEREAPGRDAAARAPIDTFRDAVAAARGEDTPRPRRPRIAASVRSDAAPVRGGDGTAAKGQTPYMVAASILDERADGDALTPEALREALAGRGVDVSMTTAQALLRELRPPLSSRLSSRRPGREPPAGGAGNGDRRPSR
ncbi:MAG TPA: DUF2637 domain-containing protein [Actinomycetes bacterium]|nr:DUF2637 domain-containing protein [Actinomycetes bacterium]